MSKRPRLAEPVIVHQCWANRRHDALVVSLSTFKDINIIDVRKHSMSKDGRLQPTPKGIALKVTRLPDLLEGVKKAVKKAHELGLIDDDGAGE
jgi:Transcriptional Coactivator p15 (PC4)